MPPRATAVNLQQQQQQQARVAWERLKYTSSGSQLVPLGLTQLSEGRLLSKDVLRSVLKVFVVKAEPNFAQPWQVRPQR